MVSFLPIHRLFGALMLLMIASFVTWACVGQLDIVVVASGKLVPSSFVKISQPVEAGAVKSIFVKDGDHVSAGQALVQMDSVFADEDVEAEKAETEQQHLKLARIAAELADAPFAPETGTLALVQAVSSEYTLRREAYQTAIKDAGFAIAKADADYEAASAKLDKLLRTSPLAVEQAQIHQGLQAAALISRSATIDKLAASEDATGELITQRRVLLSAGFAKAQARSALEKVQTEYRKTLALEQSEAEGTLAKAQFELKKREYRADQLVLRAPTSGVVTGLTVRTEGQVLAAGATVLSLVPDSEPVIFEGWLKNEDAPYVVPGMVGKVKLVAYPFQKYGWTEGAVSWLGADSEVPDSMKNESGDPLFYRLRIKLDAQQLYRNGKAFPLKVGMQGQGDVQIGRRTLAEYLLSPVKKAILEAAREK
jgi:hemolysin D